jgi:hypothetical protein
MRKIHRSFRIVAVMAMLVLVLAALQPATVAQTGDEEPDSSEATQAVDEGEPGVDAPADDDEPGAGETAEDEPYVDEPVDDEPVDDADTPADAEPGLDVPADDGGSTDPCRLEDWDEAGVGVLPAAGWDECGGAGDDAIVDGSYTLGAAVERDDCPLAQGYAAGEGPNLFGVLLDGCDLAGQKLDSAYLENARLNQTNLANADLTGANLSRANLDGADLFGAICPDGEEATVLYDFDTQRLSGKCEGHFDPRI